MNAFTAFATHTPAQKKGFYITAAIAAAVCLVALLAGGAAGINPGGAIVLMVLTGLATGITARRSFTSAWGYATTTVPVWTGARKFGIAWRAAAAFCLGRFVMTFASSITDGDGFMSLVALVAGLGLTMYAAMMLGQQYGHIQAKTQAGSNIAVDTQARSHATANIPVDTQASSQAAAIAAVGTQTGTRVPASPGAVAQVGDGNKKGGNFAKGKWGLWVGAGLGVLFLGFLGFNYAKQSGPEDTAAIAEDHAITDALTSDSSAQSATPPPTQVAAPAPPPAPVAAAAIPADGPALDNVFAIAAKVAKENPNDDSLINGEDDTSLATPVFAGRISQGGYPVYALQCDFQKQQCTFHNGMGNSLVVSVVDAANSLSPIRNADAINPAYQCQENICMDSQGQVVGTVSLDMRNYLANHTTR